MHETVVNDAARGRRSVGSGEAISTLLRVGATPAGHRAGDEKARTLQVRFAMKPVPVGIPSKATLEDAEERMDAEGVNWLPVVDRGRLVGLLTRLDIRQARASPLRTR